MAVSKLSAIAAAGANPAQTDSLVGVTSGNVDKLFTIAEVSAALRGARLNDNIALGNPSTTSASFKMGGLAISYTPSASGKVLVIMNGVPHVGASTNNNVYLAHGTGSAPSAGDAATGTQDTQPKGSFSSDCMAVMTALLSLTPGTTYWFDVAIQSDGTNNFAFNRPEFQAIELP